MIDTTKVEKEGNINKFTGQTSCKDFRGWLESRIGIFTRRNNEEYRQVFIEILRAYNHFEPRKESQVKVDSWKGESSFEIIKELDKLIIIKFQKKQKGDEPTEVRTEVSKEELQSLISSLLKYKDEENVKTRELAFRYCYFMNYNEILNGEFWKNFFSNRKLHNKFTLMLGALDKLGLVEYKGGKTRFCRELGAYH